MIRANSAKNFVTVLFALVGYFSLAPLGGNFVTSRVLNFVTLLVFSWGVASQNQTVTKLVYSQKFRGWPAISELALRPALTV